MSLEISNIEYNLIRKKLKQLEEAYKQSNDDIIRISVKDRMFFDLCTGIPLFMNFFTSILKPVKWQV